MAEQQKQPLTREQLMMLFQVGPDDLAANRAGQMGGRQSRVLLMKARLMRAIMVLLVVPFVFFHRLAFGVGDYGWFGGAGHRGDGLDGTGYLV